MNRPKTLLILVLGTLSLFLLLQVANGYKVYAVSRGLYVWTNGSWKYLAPPYIYTFGHGGFKSSGLDRNGNLLFTASSDPRGSSGALRIWSWNTTSETLIGSDVHYFGSFAFDSTNQIYTRFHSGTEVRGLLRPETFMTSDSYTVLGEFYSEDLTSFRQGRAIVVVGNFTQIKLPDASLLPSSENVALWDTKTMTWQSLGDGIPSVPSRVVTNSDETQLAALSGSTLWRWNGTEKAWTAHELVLTSSHGAPDITDLAFGGYNLFLVGNFDTVNGVKCKNVTKIVFGPNGTISVTGLGMGLPGVRPHRVWARSPTQIFIGGSIKETYKVVYEWRQGRNSPWGRLGDRMPALDNDPSDIIFGLAVTK